MNGSFSPGSGTGSGRTSIEVSRKPSTRTLRFEDETTPNTPSVASGGSWNMLPPGGTMGSRKPSDASAVSGSSASVSASNRGSDFMMVRRPSDQSIVAMEEDTPHGFVTAADSTDLSTNLKRLALANSNRARAGTFSTIASGGTGQTSGSGSEPLDIPNSKERDGTGSASVSPRYGISGSPSSSAPPPSPGFEPDPDAPEYTSELSEEEDDAPPEVPSKDGPPPSLHLSQKRVNRKASASNDSGGYPSTGLMDEDEHTQYASYIPDGESEFDDDSRSRGTWSSPGTDYGFQKVSSPFSAPVPGMISTFKRGGSKRGARSSTLPYSTVATVFPTRSGSTSSSGTISAQHSPAYSIRSHREAKNLVQQVQNEILENAQAGGSNLRDQLAAYGESLAIERRFAIGEKQRWTNTAKEEDDSETGNLTRTLSAVFEGDGNDGVQQVEQESESERSLKERADMRVRERKAQGTLSQVPSYNSLHRVAKGGVRPKPKPLVSKRPHTSSGVSGMQGTISSLSHCLNADFHIVTRDDRAKSSHIGHRVSRSVTAPIVTRQRSESTDRQSNERKLLEDREGNESGVEIVQTDATPPGSSSPSSPSSPIDSSDIKSYSFAPSSPLRISLNENGDLDESPMSRTSNIQFKPLKNGNSMSNTIGSGYSFDAPVSAPITISTSVGPNLSPILSESSSNSTHTYPTKRRSKVPPIPSSFNTNNPSPLSSSLPNGSDPFAAHGRSSTLPPYSPTSSTFQVSGLPSSELPGRPSPLDFAPAGMKVPRKSTASDRSGLSGSSDSTTFAVGTGSFVRDGSNNSSGSIKSVKKNRFGTLRNFVQTIKGNK